MRLQALKHGRNPLKNIRFVASDTDAAQHAVQRLVRRYGNASLKDADVIVAIGGDGFMLHTLHETLIYKLPIYGMNKGTIGFLMNQYNEEGLPERLRLAQSAQWHPLSMRAYCDGTENINALAINEVSLLRQTRQAAKIRIYVNDAVKLDELVCDGVLVATAAGSTAYNASAHGPILPLSAGILALTPISPFRPRRWRGALLSRQARIKFEIIDSQKRAVSATADYQEVRNVARVDIAEENDITLRLLFDPEHNLEDRILNEQFMI